MSAFLLIYILLIYMHAHTHAHTHRKADIYISKMYISKKADIYMYVYNLDYIDIYMSAFVCMCACMRVRAHTHTVNIYDFVI